MGTCHQSSLPIVRLYLLFLVRVTLEKPTLDPSQKGVVSLGDPCTNSTSFLGARGEPGPGSGSSPEQMQIVALKPCRGSESHRQLWKLGTSEAEADVAGPLPKATQLASSEAMNPGRQAMFRLRPAQQGARGRKVQSCEPAA